MPAGTYWASDPMGMFHTLRLEKGQSRLSRVPDGAAATSTGSGVHVGVGGARGVDVGCVRLAGGGPPCAGGCDGVSTGCGGGAIGRASTAVAERRGVTTALATSLCGGPVATSARVRPPSWVESADAAATARTTADTRAAGSTNRRTALRPSARPASEAVSRCSFDSKPLPSALDHHLPALGSHPFRAAQWRQPNGGEFVIDVTRSARASVNGTANRIRMVSQTMSAESMSYRLRPSIHGRDVATDGIHRWPRLSRPRSAAAIRVERCYPGCWPRRCWPRR